MFKKYPSYCCQRCGELVGWIGRLLPFHRCEIEMFEEVKHETNKFLFKINSMIDFKDTDEKWKTGYIVKMEILTEDNCINSLSSNFNFLDNLRKHEEE